MPEHTTDTRQGAASEQGSRRGCGSPQVAEQGPLHRPACLQSISWSLQNPLRRWEP